jgi:hypothetical protein
MIKNLVNSRLRPKQLIAAIEKLDMTAEIKQLASQLHERSADSAGLPEGAAILHSTNVHTGTLTLYYNASGNISLKSPNNSRTSPHLYSVPGASVLFSINAQPYCVQLYAVEDDHLTPTAQITVDARNPLFIDGTKVLYESNPEGTGHPAFIGSINFPDPRADISVFDYESLRKVGWFPHDQSAARYLVALELLEAVRDPDTVKVATELIYHFHPAVAWRAFQLLHACDPHASHQYAGQLRKLHNAHLDGLLTRLLGEAA